MHPTSCQPRPTPCNPQSMVTDEFKTTYGETHVGAVNPVYATAKVDPLVAK